MRRRPPRSTRTYTLFPYPTRFRSPHHGGEQGFLVAIMAVHGGLGDAGAGRDLVHAGAVEALAGKQPAGGVQDRAALLHVLGTTGCGGGLGVGSGHFLGHDTILDYPVCYLYQTDRFIILPSWVSQDRTRAVEGKRVTVRGGLGGGSI